MDVVSSPDVNYDGTEATEDWLAGYTPRRTRPWQDYWKYLSSHDISPLERDPKAAAARGPVGAKVGAPGGLIPRRNWMRFSRQQFISQINIAAWRKRRVNMGPMDNATGPWLIRTLS